MRFLISVGPGWETIIFCLLIVSLSVYSQRRITRGSEPGEIYIASDMYQVSSAYVKYGIFHSTDYGKHLELKYENFEVPPPGEMQVARILGGATPGTLYNYGWGDLWISLDFGVSWEYLESYGSSGRYASGCLEGEIYKCCSDVYGTIFRSTDYGITFDTISQSEKTKYPLEVGINEGEIYGIAGEAFVGYNLYFSPDYGLTFTTIPIDSSVAFTFVGGYVPKISRGTEPGELFLVSWWSDYRFKIFHSTDYGYTWDFKYESEVINNYFWKIHYTAGRAPGSFYVTRGIINVPTNSVWFYIDYSNDYGETFTTYFHDLGEWVGIDSINNFGKQIELSLYPNPVGQLLNVNWQTNIGHQFNQIQIHDITGKEIQVFDIPKTKTECKIDVSTLDPGIYIITVISNNGESRSEKFVIDR